MQQFWVYNRILCYNIEPNVYIKTCQRRVYYITPGLVEIKGKFLLFFAFLLPVANLKKKGFSEFFVSL